MLSTRRVRLRGCDGTDRELTLSAGALDEITNLRWLGTDHLIAEARRDTFEGAPGLRDERIFDLDGTFLRAVVTEDVENGLAVGDRRVCPTAAGLIILEADGSASLTSPTGEALATTDPSDPTWPGFDTTWPPAPGEQRSSPPQCEPFGAIYSHTDGAFWLWDGSWSEIGPGCTSSEGGCEKGGWAGPDIQFDSNRWIRRPQGDWNLVMEAQNETRFFIRALDATGNQLWRNDSFRLASAPQNSPHHQMSATFSPNPTTDGDLLFRFQAFSRDVGNPVALEGFPAAEIFQLLVRLDGATGEVVFATPFAGPSVPRVDVGGVPSPDQHGPGNDGLRVLGGDECNGSLHSFENVHHRLDEAGAPAPLRP